MTPRVPIVDAGALRTADAGELAKLATAIGRASREIGFFTVVNHGIPEALTANVFASMRTFFALPQAEKERTAIEKSPAYCGYARLGAEKLDPARPGDAKESFNIGRDLGADDPSVLAGEPFHGTNQWPEVPGFREHATAYFTAMMDLIVALHRPVALDLGLDDLDYFEQYLDKPLATLRLLRYPPHPGTFDGGLYGAAPHTDYGNLTLLAQDDAGGLEVRARDGTWVPVEPSPGSFVCNIGDALMRWSNDIYVSTPHRVVNRSGRERFSIAFFGDPNADARIACLPACATPQRPAKYAPIDYATYQREIYDATYGART